LIRELAVVVTLLPFVFTARPDQAEQVSARKYPRAPLPSRRRSES
jgi:hypothetical protein